MWHILADGEFELMLANAAHIKNVPGRKTDVKDADWISDLLAHGLIRASFVPDSETQEMRTLMRTRKQLVREQSRHILRIQKTLEDANIKLDSVITDIIGVSARKMIEALIAGQSDPAKLARLADHRVKASQESLRDALRGRVTRRHRFLLRLHLDQIASAEIVDCDHGAASRALAIDHGEPDQVGVIKLIRLVRLRQPLARHVELDVGQALGGIAIGNAFEGRDEMILGGAQRFDLHHTPVLGLERPVIDDRLRIGGERPQPHFAAHAVSGADCTASNRHELLQRLSSAL